MGDNATKPRAFIGSSAEGIGIAYAVQQNLLHDVETTVWDQGVFEISATTIESLTSTLETVDFGIFVFNPDDIVHMRNTVSASVRDNVIFEAGLFMGKLGRERVFFLVPNNTELHIASDLLGVIPAKYDATRSDGLMQAATGPACHLIRTQIKKVGLLPGRTTAPTAPEQTTAQGPERKEWIVDFIEGRYDDAKATLMDELTGLTGEKLLSQQAWILFCEAKAEQNLDFKKVYDFAKDHPESIEVQTTVAYFLNREHYVDQAIKLLSEVGPELRSNPAIVVPLASFHARNDDTDTSLAILEAASPSERPPIALKMAEIFEEQDRSADALDVIHACYMKNPSDRQIRFKYARLAQDAELPTVALYLFDGLSKDDHESSQYWGYLGNACRSLELDDNALAAYRKGLLHLKSYESGDWLVSNIGNVFFNRELYSDACENLEKALEKNPKSEYAHNRLASSLSAKELAAKEYKKKCAEGLRAIRAKDAERNKPKEEKPVISPSPLDALTQVFPMPPSSTL